MPVGVSTRVPGPVRVTPSAGFVRTAGGAVMSVCGAVTVCGEPVRGTFTGSSRGVGRKLPAPSPSGLVPLMFDGPRQSGPNSPPSPAPMPRLIASAFQSTLMSLLPVAQVARAWANTSVPSWIAAPRTALMAKFPTKDSSPRAPTTRLTTDTMKEIASPTTPNSEESRAPRPGSAKLRIRPKIDARPEIISASLMSSIVVSSWFAYDWSDSLTRQAVIADSRTWSATPPLGAPAPPGASA
ncbi:hypothetical protein [Streptomyces liangshanensis]|uniref:Uncharacterized protein n=1 Tax=Streptomyces liangshanensis TaxID=2717324 RepID=A0A6G9GZL8_9ACTN|nr:hypothetical protein [Streptomyces liangshanensis]QIQ03516.1 hypothetical protein HA039_15305 [Streptomyces liangshanensis]